jgi:hypothetical protein
MNNYTLKDIKRLAFAKHGERWALHLAALIGGNLNHKKTWWDVLHHEEITDQKKADHQAWCESLKKFPDMTEKFMYNAFNEEGDLIGHLPRSAPPKIGEEVFKQRWRIIRCNGTNVTCRKI